MNLYQKVIDDNSWEKVIPSAIIIAIMIFLIVKFGVFGRITYLASINGQLSRAEAQLEQLQEQIEGYDELKSKYIRYTDDFKKDEEGSLVDRVDIIRLIEQKTSGIGEVSSVDIKGNTVSLKVSVSVLDDVRKIRKQLEAVDWVANVKVFTANRDSTETGDKVTASIVFDAVNEMSDGQSPLKEEGVEDKAADAHEGIEANAGVLNGEEVLG